MNDIPLSIQPDERRDDLPRSIRIAKAAQAEQAAAAARETVIKDIDVPFGRLVRFFLKCAVAAIPALLLLSVLSYGLAEVANWVLPDWIKLHFMMGG